MKHTLDFNLDLLLYNKNYIKIAFSSDEVTNFTSFTEVDIIYLFISPIEDITRYNHKQDNKPREDIKHAPPITGDHIIYYKLGKIKFNREKILLFLNTLML